MGILQNEPNLVKPKWGGIIETVPELFQYLLSGKTLIAGAGIFRIDYLIPVTGGVYKKSYIYSVYI